MTDHSCNLLEISRTKEEIVLQLSLKNRKRKIRKRENYGDGKEKQRLLGKLGKGRIEQVR